MHFIRDSFLARCLAVILVSTFALMSACGGGGGNTTPPVTPPASPVFSSTAPTAANEGDQYSYSISATDPAGSNVTFRLVSGPAGAAISGNILSWTPTHEQSRTRNSFVVEARTAKGGVATQPFDVTPSGTIRGTAIDQHIVNRGLVDVPWDDTYIAPIEALVPDGQGGFAHVPAVPTGNGGFGIAHMPAGHYWLTTVRPSSRPLTPPLPLPAAPFRYLWTSASDVDLGTTLQGRPDITWPETPVTGSFDLSFSSEIGINDHLFLYTPNVRSSTTLNQDEGGTWGFLLGPPLGTLTPIHPLIESSKGDESYVVRILTSSELWSDQKITEVLGPLSIQEVEGSSYTVTGTLSPAAPNLTMHPLIRKQEFKDIIEASVPGAEMTGAISVRDVSYDGSAGPGEGAVLQQIGIDRLTDNGTSPLDLGEIALSSPFLGHTVSTNISVHGSSPITFPIDPGTMSPFVPTVSMVSTSTSLPLQDVPIAPQIGTVRTPVIDGKTLLQEEHDIALTPVISWTAPSVGTPTFYEVSIVNIRTETVGPPCDPPGCLLPPESTEPISFWLLPSFFTRETQLQVPPDTLQPGLTYSITITAVYAPDLDAERRPFKTAGEFHCASVSSAAITTAGTPPETGAGSLRKTGRQFLVFRNVSGQLKVEAVRR